MKSTKQLHKRSISPFAYSKTKNVQTSERKRQKKTSSIIPSNPYKNIKDFQTYEKSDKKKQSSYLKQLLKMPVGNERARVFTEPAEIRQNIINQSYKRNNRSKPRIDQYLEGERYPNIKLRSHQNSQQKHNKPQSQVCANCQKHLDELNYIKSQINKVFMSKILWKNGQLNLSDFIKEDVQIKIKGKTKSKDCYKSSQNIVKETKKHFGDLMKDIESISEIDYTKMLSLKIFKYQPTFDNSKLPEYGQLKSLLGQVRSHYQGRVTQQDLEDDYEQDSTHLKLIMRNLKTRLSNVLRQNLELRTNKRIMQKVDEISFQSEDCLKRIVESVLSSYTAQI